MGEMGTPTGSTLAMKLAAEAAALGAELPKTPVVFGEPKESDPQVDAELELRGRALLFLNPVVDYESLASYGMQIVGQLQLLTIQSQRLMTSMRQKAQESMLVAVKASLATQASQSARGGGAGTSTEAEGGRSGGGIGSRATAAGVAGGTRSGLGAADAGTMGAAEAHTPHEHLMQRLEEMWDEINLAIFADMQWREAAMSFVQNMVMQIVRADDEDPFKRPGVRGKHLPALNAALSDNMLERAAELELNEMATRGRLFGEDWDSDPEAGTPDPEPGREPLAPPGRDPHPDVATWTTIATDFLACSITAVPVLRVFSSCLQMAFASPHVTTEQYLEIVVHMLASRGGPPSVPFSAAVEALQTAKPAAPGSASGKSSAAAALAAAAALPTLKHG